MKLSVDNVKVGLSMPATLNNGLYAHKQLQMSALVLFEHPALRLIVFATKSVIGFSLDDGPRVTQVPLEEHLVGQWFHVAFVVDGELSRVQLLVNGQCPPRSTCVLDLSLLLLVSCACLSASWLCWRRGTDVCLVVNTITFVGWCFSIALTWLWS